MEEISEEGVTQTPLPSLTNQILVLFQLIVVIQRPRRELLLQPQQRLPLRPQVKRPKSQQRITRKEEPRRLQKLEMSKVKIHYIFSFRKEISISYF